MENGVGNGGGGGGEAAKTPGMQLRFPLLIIKFASDDGRTK